MRKPVENSEFGIRSTEWVHSELLTPHSALRSLSYMWFVAVSVWTAADQSALASLRWKHLRLAVFGKLEPSPIVTIGSVRKIRTVPIFLGMLLGLGLAVPAGWTEQPANAATPGEEQLVVIPKEMTGEVVWIGKRAISVEYERTKEESREMLLPINSKLKLERIKSLAELKRGDTVHVQYDQTLKKTDEKDPGTLVNTLATKVALVRQAPVGAPTQSSQLTSGE